MTISGISHITVYVEDQEDALNWYRDKLGFEVCMDNSDVVPDLRWLTVCPAGNKATQFVLLGARNDDEKSRIGQNLMTVLSTNDCRADLARLSAMDVDVVKAPAEVPWGISAIIRDLYGNPYNLVGPK